MVGRVARTSDLEGLIGRVMINFTVLSVVLLVVGVVLMVAAGIAPTAGGPGLDLSTLRAQVLALEPAGFIWVGLLVVIATPITRVMLAGLGYARNRDWLMVGVAAGIVSIIAIGIATAGTATF